MQQAHQAAGLAGCILVRHLSSVPSVQRSRITTKSSANCNPVDKTASPMCVELTKRIFMNLLATASMPFSTSREARDELILRIVDSDPRYKAANSRPPRCYTAACNALPSSAPGITIKTWRRRSSITELSFHGINTSHKMAKSVTHVSGTIRHLFLRSSTQINGSKRRRRSRGACR